MSPNRSCLGRDADAGDLAPLMGGGAQALWVTPASSRFE